MRHTETPLLPAPLAGRHFARRGTRRRAFAILKASRPSYARWAGRRHLLDVASEGEQCDLYGLL